MKLRQRRLRALEVEVVRVPVPQDKPDHSDVADGGFSEIVAELVGAEP